MNQTGKYIIGPLKRSPFPNSGKIVEYWLHYETTSKMKEKSSWECQICSLNWAWLKNGVGRGVWCNGLYFSLGVFVIYLLYSSSLLIASACIGPMFIIMINFSPRISQASVPTSLDLNVWKDYARKKGVDSSALSALLANDSAIKVNFECGVLFPTILGQFLGSPPLRRYFPCQRRNSQIA